MRRKVGQGRQGVEGMGEVGGDRGGMGKESDAPPTQRTAQIRVGKDAVKAESEAGSWRASGEFGISEDETPGRSRAAARDGSAPSRETVVPGFEDGSETEAEGSARGKPGRRHDCRQSRQSPKIWQVGGARDTDGPSVDRSR